MELVDFFATTIPLSLIAFLQLYFFSKLIFFFNYIAVYHSFDKFEKQLADNNNKMNPYIKIALKNINIYLLGGLLVISIITQFTYGFNFPFY